MEQRFQELQLVLADVGGLRAGEADEIVRRDANRLFV
jgi:hypothetical protein